jgi:probable addiction module antidote protein
MKSIDLLNKALKERDYNAFAYVLNELCRIDSYGVISKRTGLAREGMYRILDQNTDPRFKSIVSIINALGFELVIEKQSIKNIDNEVNSLASLYPQIAADWDYKKNSSMPEYLSIKSRKKFWWSCNRSHQYKQSVIKRIKGEGCPYCAAEDLLKQTNKE